MEAWECTICGYIYTPAENNGIPFEKLPGGWICPECGADIEMFSEVS